MGFNRKNIIKVRDEYVQKQSRAWALSDAKRQALWEKIPGLVDIDKALSTTGLRIVKVTLAKGDNVREQINQIKLDNEKLLAERAALLAAYGYPEDYTDVVYECDKCKDTGYIETNMCDCMKKALILAGYESSGLGELLKNQSFDNFSLEYYRQSRSYEAIKFAFEKVKQFALTFDGSTSKSFLFMGGTGLGKTHLSTAVAKTVIDRHFDVLYVTATELVGDFERKQFGKETNDGESEDTKRYYSADLLIIDDLGTEMTNQFTISCLFDVINYRMNTKKSTIISTNMGKAEMEKRYTDRIASRIYGEYIPVVFDGVDIRRQKIMNPKK